jgi:hypothetical protein
LPHNAATSLHLPPWHVLTVQGSLSFSHCESLQHSAQPTPSQHRFAGESASQNLCWHKPPSHVSLVQLALSSQMLTLSPGKPVQIWRSLQPSLAAQYSVMAHWPSSGTNMHCPAKQVFAVQLTWSSQSALSQHSLHSPLQHLSAPPHFGDASHVPSALQRSVVQMFLSSQSSGPSQLTRAPAPLAPLPETPLPVPPLPLLPPVLVAPESAESSSAVKASPAQPLVQTAGSKVPAKARSRNLGLKKLTEFSSTK